MSLAGTAEAGFSITVEPSGRAFHVTGDETILSAAIRQGIGLPYGCKDGACGSCKCKKLSGTVTMDSHQSKALSADEELAGLILTCRSHPTSDVVLESRQVTRQARPTRKYPRQRWTRSPDRPSTRPAPAAAPHPLATLPARCCPSRPEPWSGGRP